MCLAVPARIVEIDNEMGIVEMGGVKRDVSLLLLENASVGDYVIVHAGFAIQKMDEQQALESLALLKQMLADSDGSKG